MEISLDAKSFARFLPVLVRSVFGTSKLAHDFGAWFISGVFAPFNFLSCLKIRPLPKILASRLVASLRLATLAERQTCLNKINERAAFERFKKMQGHWRMHSYCVRFSREKSQRYLTNYSYLSKKQNSA